MIFIPTIIYIFLIQLFIFISNKESENLYKRIFIKINIFLYIPIIIINCFLLSKFIKTNYIITVLNLAMIDFLSLEIYGIIFEKFKCFIFFIYSIFIKSMSIIIFYFYHLHIFHIIDTKVVIYLSIISFYMTLYIIMNYYCIENYYNDEEYLLFVMEFEYLIFWPIFLFIGLFIIIIIFIVLIVILLLIKIYFFLCRIIS